MLLALLQIEKNLGADKNQLKAYSKKYFDPFGRGDRIPFFSNNTCIITTIGQLNFYKWFIEKVLIL